jgi:hypothetical protein
MSLSPGIVGAKTQLVDGVQVDTISSLATSTTTFTNNVVVSGSTLLSGGVLTAGNTSGTAIASGYIGEVQAAASYDANYSDNSVHTLVSLTLTTGIWKVTYHIGSTNNGAVNAGCYFLAGARYADSTFTPAGGTNSGVTDRGAMIQVVPITGGYHSNTMGEMEGLVTVKQTDSDKNIYLRIINSGYASGAPYYYGKIIAIRVL